MDVLQVFWFIVYIACIACYAMLDGFDIGVGALHLFSKKDEERRVFLNAIGPVWDGNEVWLVVTTGALFAGFPFAYATLFSVLYLPVVGLICSLIFRAVAIEFRSKVEKKWWRQMWDILFSLASIVIALGVGGMLGNLIRGIPLDHNHDYAGTSFLEFLQPYQLLVGVFALSVFMLHGALYLVMKTEGELHKKIKGWVPLAIGFFVMTYAITTVVTLVYQPHMVEHLRIRPILFIIVLGNLTTIACMVFFTIKDWVGRAFLSSCLNICFLVILFALGTFPNIVRSSIDPENNSLTVSNASASPTTLTVLAIIVAIGIPLVIAYGFYIYRIFRGKVRLDHMSY